MKWNESAILAAAMRGPDIYHRDARTLKDVTTGVLRWFADYHWGLYTSPQGAQAHPGTERAAPLWSQRRSEHFRGHIVMAFQVLLAEEVEGVKEYLEWLTKYGFGELADLLQEEGVDNGKEQ